MHEGFINFNAGTLGVSMVEGRISAGVVVGDVRIWRVVDNGYIVWWRNIVSVGEQCSSAKGLGYKK